MVIATFDLITVAGMELQCNIEYLGQNFWAKNILGKNFQMVGWISDVILFQWRILLIKAQQIDHEYRSG